MALTNEYSDQAEETSETETVSENSESSTNDITQDSNSDESSGTATQGEDPEKKQSTEELTEESKNDASTEHGKNTDAAKRWCLGPGHSSSMGQNRSNLKKEMLSTVEPEPKGIILCTKGQTDVGQGAEDTSSDPNNNYDADDEDTDNEGQNVTPTEQVLTSGRPGLRPRKHVNHTNHAVFIAVSTSDKSLKRVAIACSNLLYGVKDINEEYNNLHDAPA